MKPYLIMLALLSMALGACARPGTDQPGAPGTPDTRTAGCASLVAPSPTFTAGATMYPTDQALSAALDRIRERGAGDFADVFAGLEVVPEEGSGIVYRVPTDGRAFDKVVHDVAGTTCVRIEDAKHSARDLQGVADRIADDMESLRTQGIVVNSVSALHTGAGVEVGVEAGSIERAKTELPKRYGSTPPIVVVEQGPIVPAIG